MAHSDNFHQGVGLDLHARTTIKEYYSFIETAALRVGDYTMEFHPDHVSLNGVLYIPADLPITFGEEYIYTISNVEVGEEKDSSKRQYYKVDLHEESSIVFKFYRKYLTINISGNEGDFGDSVGLLGEYGTGNMISRDGRVMDNFDNFAFEWQVNREDPVIFSNERSPQLPYERCRLPTIAKPQRSLLRKEKDLVAKANKACSHVSSGSFDLCVDDILQTGDLGLAAEW